MAIIDASEKHKLEMKDLMIRFPHLMEQILRKLDNESLVKSIGVARIWKEFIDDTKYPWVRIVKIPTILQAGDTYLHLAAKHNQIDAFEEILNGQVKKADLVNDSGYSPFLVACLFGSLRIAEFLMKKSEEFKIDLSRKTGKTKGMTAFDLARIGKHSELAEIIMENSVELKIHSNEENERGFLRAVRCGHFEIVERLIKRMSIKLNISDRIGYNALHIACTNHHQKIAKILIKNAKKLKLDLNARGLYGFTAFHMACKAGLAGVVELMLDQAERFDLTSKTKTGSTGFQLAKKNGKENVAGLIQSKMPSLVVYTEEILLISNKRNA